MAARWGYITNITQHNEETMVSQEGTRKSELSSFGLVENWERLSTLKRCYTVILCDPVTIYNPETPCNTIIKPSATFKRTLLKYFETVLKRTNMWTLWPLQQGVDKVIFVECCPTCLSKGQERSKQKRHWGAVNLIIMFHVYIYINWYVFICASKTKMLFQSLTGTPTLNLTWADKQSFTARWDPT